MTQPQSTKRTVLGVYVGSSTIEGVLIQAPDDGPARLLHRIVRSRPRAGDIGGSDDLSQTLPGLKSSDDIDFTLEIGGGGGSSPLSDSDPYNNGKDEDEVSNGRPDPTVVPFHRVLKEMLDECAKLGYKNPELAFCATPPDVSYKVVSAPRTDSDKAGSKGSAESPSATLSRKKLLKLLGPSSGDVDQTRIAFHPMTDDSDEERYLAVLPAADDSITASITQLKKSTEEPVSPARLMDSENTLLAGMARHHSDNDDTHTAVVRVGPEDTLILFLKDGRLNHCERLRSLTSYDVPDTVCSRVMLQQDEHKISSLDTIYIVGGGVEERLKESFRSFYPDAAVLSLQEALPLDQWEPSEKAGEFTAGSLPAIAAALQVVYPDASGMGTDLLTSSTKRRRRRFPVAWHSVAAVFLLIGVSLFFGWQYNIGEEEVAQHREAMENDPVQMPEVGPAELESQIDSLHRAHQEHTRALDVLDSLLMGSDMWSRTLERTSTATGQVGSLWFTRWQSQGSSSIRIEGVALNRSRVAVLANRLDATIERLEYDEENETRLYPFTILAPLRQEMPEVATYLQQVAEGASPEEVDDDAAELLQSAGLSH